MNKFKSNAIVASNKFNQPNLRLVPATAKKKQVYCRHCGDAIEPSEGEFHLAGCRPDIAEAIAQEYDRKEAFAVQLTMN